MNIDKLIDLYGENFIVYGLNENTSQEEFMSMLMHINNMGGVDEDQFDEIFDLAQEPDTLDKVKEKLLSAD